MTWSDGNYLVLQLLSIDVGRAKIMPKAQHRMISEMKKNCRVTAADSLTSLVRSELYTIHWTAIISTKGHHRQSHCSPTRPEVYQRPCGYSTTLLGKCFWTDETNVEFSGKINFQFYQGIQQNNVRIAVYKLKLRKSCKMQQDNDPKHYRKLRNARWADVIVIVSQNTITN